MSAESGGIGRAQTLRDLEEGISRYGFMVRKVVAGPGEEEWPQFAYTVGLTAFGHPEILCHGLPPDTAHLLLNECGERIRRGDRFTADTLNRTLAANDMPLAFIRVDDSSELTGVLDVYGRVDALQLVWPDSELRFPWVPGCAISEHQQPLRGSWGETSVYE